MSIVDKVKELIQPKIEEANYILSDVLYEKEGSHFFLRVIIDKEGTVDIDDCVEVTKIINPILDELDVMESNYILDVSSKEKGDN